MRLYQPVCDDCGAAGPTLANPGSAAVSVRNHRCDDVCLNCQWSCPRPRHRGLCGRCYLTDARFDFADRRGQRRADLVEDAEWLADDGANLTQALDRLGYRYAESFRRACSRAGRLDVYERLADRENDREMRANIRAAIRERVA